MVRCAMIMLWTSVERWMGGWVGGWLNRLEIDDGAVADHSEEDECYRYSIYNEECVVVWTYSDDGWTVVRCRHRQELAASCYLNRTETEAIEGGDDGG